MITLIELSTGPTSSRLEPNEIEAIFKVLIQVHDHSASRPAVPVWWERGVSDGEQKN